MRKSRQSQSQEESRAHPTVALDYMGNFDPEAIARPSDELFAECEQYGEKPDIVVVVSEVAAGDYPSLRRLLQEEFDRRNGVIEYYI